MAQWSLRCLLGFHHRSRRQAREEGLRIVSRCERCGAPMEKGRDDTWRVSGQGDERG